MRFSLKSLTVAATFAFAPLVMSAQQEKLPPAPVAAVTLNPPFPQPNSVQTRNTEC